jgi:hypothetical protein
VSRGMAAVSSRIVVCRKGKGLKIKPSVPFYPRKVRED